jgi:hypothetical protein
VTDAVLVVERRYPCGHVVAMDRRPHVQCDRCGEPGAERCYYMVWSSGGGTSFFYYCSRCWITDGPDGTSLRDRASGEREREDGT